MKKLAFCLVLVLYNFSLGNAAVVGNYNLNWGYTPDSDPAVTGYNVYCDNIWVGFVTGAHAEGGDVIFLIDQRFKERSLTFTITATFADGSESGHSAPALVNNPVFKTGISAPTGFKLSISNGVWDWKEEFFFFKNEKIYFFREKITMG